jgi:ketosteroid isomerase-like protein/dienelactone hydrolase
MSRSSVRGILLTLAFAACTLADESGATLEVPAIGPEALRSRLAEAESAGDVEALASLYSDDIVLQNPWIAPVVGREAVIAVMQQLLADSRLETAYTSVALQVIGDSAVDQGNLIQTATPRSGGEVEVDTLSYRLTFRRDSGGGWKLARGLTSREDTPSLSVPELPAPTGSYAIGSLNLLATDADRDEPFTDAPTDSRRVSAQIWYPARTPPGATPSPYRTPAITRAAAAFLGWPPYFNSFFSLVQTHTYPAAEADRGGAPYPVILYHHGYGGFTTVHATLLEELASRGYVVASVGHAFESALLLTPDHDVVAFSSDNDAYVARLEEAHGDEQEEIKDAIVRADSIAEQARLYRELLRLSPLHQVSTAIWTTDGAFILDQLDGLNETSGPLQGMLDLARVGAIGHSLGGAAAGQAVLSDHRVIAGVDLDGFMFGDMIDARLSKPFMFVSAARPWAGETGSALRVFFEQSVGPAYALLVDGFEHSTFTDLPLLAAGWPGEGDAAAGRRAMEIQRAYVTAFFDRHLKGLPTALLDGPVRDFPEVRIRTR